ncbi:hypothetical protein AJ80_02706 [Polytolypa hystricis UAMH7299]|uniref:Aminoglycoside phosphotransferase domain-containing protein n=1 Tax=Polytolypa hystricis (strain UAMH7299) TaxID=1447883 RepID=A0A2B7YQ36_POLH7|nr:hypothetical protein AJ80_02706 [Polytolypa hystricis UAMH7299]
MGVVNGSSKPSCKTNANLHKSKSPGEMGMQCSLRSEMTLLFSEMQNDTLENAPNIAPPITTTVDVVYSPSFAKSRPPTVTLEEIGDLSPHRVAPGVIRLPGTNRVLKYSPFLNLVEAETLLMLAEQLPHLPVPRAYNAYKIGEVSYIIMDYVPGPTLAKCWKKLVARGERLGSFPASATLSYGPYYSRHEFNLGAVDALRASRPNPSQYNPELEKTILATTGDEIVFTHGDLIPPNIIFHNGKVTIIDWGEAGYSIKEREYYEAKKSITLPPGWDERIPEFIPAFPAENKFWLHIVDNMRLFCGV